MKQGWRSISLPRNRKTAALIKFSVIFREKSTFTLAKCVNTYFLLIVSKSSEIMFELNKHFTEVGSKLASALPHNN